MTTYISKEIGLKIVLEPKTRKKTEFGIQTTNGKHVKFREGRFMTDDQDTIEYLDNYCRRRPDIVTRLSEVDRNLVNKINQVIKEVTGSESSEMRNSVLKSLAAKKEKKKSISGDEVVQSSKRKSRSKK